MNAFQKFCFFSKSVQSRAPGNQDAFLDGGRPTPTQNEGGEVNARVGRGRSGQCSLQETYWVAILPRRSKVLSSDPVICECYCVALGVVGWRRFVASAASRLGWSRIIVSATWVYCTKSSRFHLQTQLSRQKLSTVFCQPVYRY